VADLEKSDQQRASATPSFPNQVNRRELEMDFKGALAAADSVPASPRPSAAPAVPQESIQTKSEMASAGSSGSYGAPWGAQKVKTSTRSNTFGGRMDDSRYAYADADSRYRGKNQDMLRKETAGESYAAITDNAFLRVADQALSTFSIDVDTGSYTNLRRFLNQNQLPPPDAVRIEELVNYFNYNYPQPKNEDPFSVTTEVAKAPWKEDHLLVRIGLQGQTVSTENRPAANLVFLIDVSGSMDEPNKLPLVINSMKLLVKKLKPEDRVGIAVYAGNSGMVLPSTSVSKRGEILEALSNLQAGGSTNGAMGIQLAYDMAKAHFIEGGINRVILCTDGDFNVGVTNHGDLVKLIEEKAKTKVFLSVFGFGMGNLKDSTLEQLANKGNGNYGYIDNPKEAKRVFVDQVGGTLQTIAKDVKIQVEFNPAVVGSYRLIGYENRMLAAKDFNDDKKDAGEIGAGHRVIALYELIPAGAKDDQPAVDSLKYQKTAPVEYAGDKSEIMNVKLRYKQPEGDTSKLIEHPVKNEGVRSFATPKTGWFRSAPEEASADFQFAAGVAAFGMILRDSPYKGEANFDLVLRLSEKGSADKQEDRAEFIGLVEKARSLSGDGSKAPQD
jgi:Ca-activated chloride channel family protein